MRGLGLGRGKDSERSGYSSEMAPPPPQLLVFASEIFLRDRSALGAILDQMPEGQRCEFITRSDASQMESIRSEHVLTLFIEPSQLDPIADAVLATRDGGRASHLIVAINGSQLTALGEWLERRANAGKLKGVRLILARDVGDVADQLPTRLNPMQGSNVIRMPISTEVENSERRNFYVFSPSLQELITRIGAYAENGVARLYLLGGPGAGKTSLAYYYFLQRKRGRFVTVNLSAENTGDKSAVKSLLCGHVSGAFPGAGARTGAFSMARDGVTFLDESHGVSGPVIEVLMEALDSGQYLPLGASAKQAVECAILFASNRSWNTLQNQVNLDEFTRMGAIVLTVPELNEREEDLIAVSAAVLSRQARKCTTWSAPVGLSDAAWQAVRECRWHGNVRGLTRVLEASFVETAAQAREALIQSAEVEAAIRLWEPKSHHSHQLYEPAA